MTSKSKPPPQPTQFYQAIREARRLGFWVKASRLDVGEARFVVTEAGASQALFASDNIDEVRAWLRHGGVDHA